jgi:hypothetical protein
VIGGRSCIGPETAEVKTSARDKEETMTDGVAKRREPMTP